MSTLSKDQRRINRKHVLDALYGETGSNGGDAAADRVKAYRENPLSSPTTEFAYVGALTLRRFYIDPSKPNADERGSLWLNIAKRLEKSGPPDPGGWEGLTDVKQLQAIAEEA